jgi:hypothetical protein
MARIVKWFLLSIVVMGAVLLGSCDKYNIVEPRFYAEDDIRFTISQSDSLLEYNFYLPQPSYVQIAVLNSGGGVVIVLIDDYLDAGGHGRAWNLRDSDHEKVSEGIYCIALNCSFFSRETWFEIE